METRGNPRSPQELHEMFVLVWALHNDAMSPEQAARLEELVCENSTAQEIYFDLMGLLAGLRWNLSACSESSLGVLFPALHPESNAPVMVHLAAPVARPLCGRVQISSRFVGFVASFLLIGYFVGLTGLVMWDHRQRATRYDRGREMTAESFAILTRAGDSDWEKTPNIGTDDLRAAQRLRVRTGLAELQFAAGAKVVIEGPAEFDVRSANGGFLRIGKLAAHVPPQAVGFEVETPTARVVDLGTDFRLEAGPQKTELAVIAGKVDLFPMSIAVGGGRPTSEPPRRVTAGQAVTIAAKANRTPIVQEVKFDAQWLAAVARDLPSHRSSSSVMAYQISESTVGNRRDFHGGVGLDFEVRVPIRVFSLGVFDHLGDGIDPATSPTVQLWSRDSRFTVNEISDDLGHAMLASVMFTADNSGELKQGHRFKLLPTPLELPVGSYSIVAYGLSGTNPFITFDEKHNVDFSHDLNWTGSNNNSNGNNYGWSSSTNEAGGEAGEVGGTFARTQVGSFYGDTRLSNTFDLGNKITASGKFNITNISEGWADSSGKGGFFIGHFSKAANSGFIGLEFENISESVGTNFVRVRARIQFPLNLNNPASEPTIVSARGNHTFRYTYDPNLGENGRLIMHIDDQPALVVDLTDGERSHDIQVDAFGMGATSELNSESDPAKTIQVFMDDLSYSGCQTATPANVIAVDTKGSTARLQTETSHGSIVPMGSRWGQAKPGAFPKMFGSRLGGCAAGSFEYGPKAAGSPSTGSGQRRQ